jgi:hypothetical protein
MKTVRLKNNIVLEIIPEYALPVADWYGEDFASHCVGAPDDVEQHWVYNPDNGTFSAPEPIELEPTIEERLDTLEAEKADKTDVEAVWESMAAAYQEGVQTA